MKQKVSLVLGGGGARGMAHIGVIEEFQNQGYEIVSLAGSSMGALVGAFFAMGKLDEFKQFLLSIDKIKIVNLLDFSLSKKGFIKGNKIINRLKKISPDINIEDLKIPFVAIAADIKNYEEVVFKTGSIYQAIRASISIPSVFAPVVLQDKLLVDGGVVNNIPINRIKRFKNDILVAVDVNANIPYTKIKSLTNQKYLSEISHSQKLKNFRKQIKGINFHFLDKKNNDMGLFDLLNKTIHFMIFNNSKEILKKNNPDLFIKISQDACGVFEFYKAKELIEVGREAAKQSIKENNLFHKL